MSNEDTTYHVKVTGVSAETLLAILVKLEDDPVEVWVPKSQIDDDSEVYSKESGKGGGILIVTAWWAGQRGWL